MVEMIELANIMNNATESSLLILDEIGRGTSTFDGLSIAWAVSEYIHNKLKSKAMFATHYHHLTELERDLKKARNYHVKIIEKNNELVFLRKVEEGPSSKSYGIEVASLAGLPKEVVERAKAILIKIEKEETIEIQKEKERLKQTFLFPVEDANPEEKEVMKKLKSVDIINLSPMEAFNLIAELKGMLDKN